ncbi:dTDP-4-dehydrorhamnose 3,5-epimerase [Mesosutterella sp. AGMB02718]|uniref:dTDP-4-dehydrorhamnose 3,5-epimerase n=1 Tax=Mesosutterella faecium TaxID=2925194 RepID=A0ABT7IMY2_9BURK|nr:dTDP-4-dehydrorhamnose 3,5-epimerase [Mesosutterella sp. AGMB02718]MDL2059734.1 dTDP-4-dehydrorhamnose 3,5-epimerase [Mesosutterella sp. AGMB02718]
MEKLETALPGVFVLQPRIFGDGRGYFCETWNERTMAEAGLDVRFVQDNESLSHYGVIRGLHYQKGAASQAKLVRVIEGEVLDVALDLRAGSPTFGRFAAVRLSGENHRQLFIPKGFAHGFAVLSKRAVFAYKCDAFYEPAAEGSVSALDPELGIDWGVPAAQASFSEKDRAAPSFARYRSNPDFFFGRQP